MYLTKSWSPNGSLLENEMQRFLTDFTGVAGSTQGFVPPVDVHENEKSYTLTFDLPGVNPKDVKIEVENGTLTVQGSRTFEQSEGTNPRRLERFSGTFERSFKLRTKVDQDAIQAKYKDGVLTIELPKAAEAVKREISIDLG